MACPALGRAVSPVSVAAELVRALLAQASDALGTRVERAVVTVPAYFDDSQRCATETACLLAGLTEVRLLREPEAAALTYALSQEDDTRIMGECHAPRGSATLRPRVSAATRQRSSAATRPATAREDTPRVNSTRLPSCPAARLPSCPAAQLPGCPAAQLARAHSSRCAVGHAPCASVFDLGGGTFDVSVLDVGSGVVEVRALPIPSPLSPTPLAHPSCPPLTSALIHPAPRCPPHLS